MRRANQRFFVDPNRGIHPGRLHKQRQPQLATGLEIGIGLAGLSLWLRKRDRAIEANGKLVTAERECREVQIETVSTRERIAKAMRSAGVDRSQVDDVAAMLAAGQAALDRAIEVKNLRATIEGRRRDLRFREKKLGDARLAEEAWSKDWQEVCATCWLGQREIRPTTAVVRETLEALLELDSTLENERS